MYPVSILVATIVMLSGIGGAALFASIFLTIFPRLGPEYVLVTLTAAISKGRLSGDSSHAFVMPTIWAALE